MIHERVRINNDKSYRQRFIDYNKDCLNLAVLFWTSHFKKELEGEKTN